MNKAGTLYIVSLPIGNPEDITLRALRVLRTADLIAAEDTRIAAPLLAAHAISTPLATYRKRSGQDTTAPLLTQLRSGESVALICDAGTPTLADPGEELIRQAIDAAIPIEAVPGPSAAIVALCLSGLPTGRFAFDGFPPRTRADRRAFFDALREEERTILLYESPSYLRATLRDLLQTLGPERRIVLACNLTRPTQNLYRSTLSQAVSDFPLSLRGEITLVIQGK